MQQEKKINNMNSISVVFVFAFFLQTVMLKCEGDLMLLYSQLLPFS